MGEPLADKLKRLMKERGFTNKGLAKVSGVSRQTIIAILQGKQKTMLSTTSLKLAHSLGVRPEYFEEAPPEQVDVDTLLKEVQTRLSEARSSVPRKIPVVAEYSAGPGIDMTDYTYWDGPKAAEPYISAVRIKGDCLEPDVSDGDKVIVNAEEQPRDGDLVLCVVDGQQMVKRYRKDKGDVWLENGRGRITFEECNLQGVVVEVHHRRR